MSGEYYEKKCKCEQGRGYVDVSEDTKRGIYVKALPWLNEIDDHCMYKIDLKQVNLNLMIAAEHGYTHPPSRRGW